MTDVVPISPLHHTVAPLPLQGGPQIAANRIWALVPCAGTGSRAATEGPKQYQQIAGQALVLHTLAAFDLVSRVTQTLVVVAPGDDFFTRPGAQRSDRWCSVACGGSTRSRSVANGLAALREQGAANHEWVLVHDAARCLITPELINRLIDACESDAVGGLLAHRVPDTLKLAAGGRVVATTDRTHQWLAQTPQMFRIGPLCAALQAAGDRVTDESAAMESMGLAPKLVSGSALNFKVTYAQDFALAQAVLLGRMRKLTKDLDYDYP